MEGHAGAGRLNIDTDRTYSHILSAIGWQLCAHA